MQKLILSFISALVLSGCAGVMNPYSSDFQCPETDKGKCVSFQTA
jgi:conjugal transfer pilus assembly protein TraV